MGKRKAHKKHLLQPGLSRLEKEQKRYEKHPRIYVLEYAKASRSACHMCHGRISEGQLRFGADVSGKDWMSGSHWFHWRCVKDDTLREVGGAQRVMKLEPLKAEDRQAVEQRFAKLG